jgi:hypothetical protein
MARLTQNRMLRLLEAASEAITRTKMLADSAKEMRSFRMGEILGRLTEKGLSPDHPLADEIRELGILFDDLIELIEAHISYEATIILTEEKTYFSQSKVKANDLARGIMQRARARQKEKEKPGEPFDLEDQEFLDNLLPPTQEDLGGLLPDRIVHLGKKRPEQT